MSGPFLKQSELETALRALAESKILPVPPLWVFQLYLGRMNPLGADFSRAASSHHKNFLYGKAVGMESVFLMMAREHRHDPVMEQVRGVISRGFLEAAQAPDTSPLQRQIFDYLGVSLSSSSVWDATIGARIAEIKAVVAAACDQPSETASAFFSGFASALSDGFLDEDQLPQKTLQRGGLYQALLTHWPHVESLRTMKEIYEWACGQLGTPCVGDLPTFTRLCNRIGLKRGRTGRPKKKSDMRRR